MYVLTNYVGTTQNYKKFIDYQTQRGYCYSLLAKLWYIYNVKMPFYESSPTNEQ